jgi:hypothetical protein
VALESLSRSGGWRRVLVPALAAAMGMAGIALAPFGLPLLPPDAFVAYMKTIGVTPSAEERGARPELPQHYADMFGWETLADDVARVAGTLSPGERAAARIYVQNYGEAGALEYFGPARRLPRVVSGHNAYWHWGPGADTGGPLIIVGGDVADHRQVFDDVREMGRTTCTLCMPYEQHQPIFVARGWKRRLSDVWPMTKHFE